MPATKPTTNHGGSCARSARGTRSSLARTPREPRLPIAPSTLWKRRTPYVRGAHPLHCSMQEKRKARLERKRQRSSATAWSPASRPPRPASCISAARAPPCSTGCSRAITAASSCCGSRTPTRRARPRRRSTRSSTACAGSASIGTGTNITSRNSGPRHAEVAHQLLERGHAYRCYMTQEELAAQREKAQAERRPFRIDSPWRDRERRPGRHAVRHPPQGAARGRDGRSTTRSRARSRSRMPSSTISSCCARTARRPTCWRWWSTTTTWASPTSSAATTISTTPSASWRSSARWAGPSRPTPMSR